MSPVIQTAAQALHHLVTAAAVVALIINVATGHEVRRRKKRDQVKCYYDLLKKQILLDMMQLKK